MGKIITIGNDQSIYNYEVPLKEPSDEKDIINFDIKNKADQYWRTPVIPNVKKMSERQRIEFIEKERQRWSEGVYVLINGELVYLTGMYYDHLTYMTFKESKAEFFMHQCHDFYFRDLTFRDPKCKGRVFMKPRRYGMSMEEVTEATYRLNENFSNNVGLQSDTNEKVRDTLLTPLINSYVKRPKYMRSDYYKPNGKLLVSSLSLNSNLAPNEDGEERGDYLLGWLKGFPSLPRSMDGNEMAYIVMDEAFKWQTSSVKETLNSNLKVLMGRKRSGVISVLSTMGDSDDYARAIMDALDIIAESNTSIRNANGYTLSGLYKWFVPATYSFDIPDDVFEVNKFGVVNIDKHEEYVENTLKSLDKNSKSYVFEKRRMPLKEADALLSAQLVTYFSKVRISERLNYLRKLTSDKKPYVRGFLEITSSGKIEFVPNEENGIWLIAVHPYYSIDKGVDTRNRFRYVDGVYFPPKNVEHIIGYDPVRYDREDTTSKSLSRASAIIHKKFDYYNSGMIDVKCALLLYRPDDARDADYEVMKACKYYGAQCMHERLIEGVKDSFVEGKMLPFLMTSGKKGRETEYGIWTDSGGKVTKNGVDMLVSRYSAPKNNEEKDQLAEYPFEEGLKDLDNFDMANTTAFDVTMSEIMLEYGLKQLNFTNATDATDNKKLKTIMEIFPPRQK